MKTHIIITLVMFLCIVFAYILHPYFYAEEIVFLYLFPYVLFIVIIGLYVALRLLLRKKESLDSFLIKVAIPSTVFHILLLFAVIVIVYPKYIQREDAIADLEYMVKTIENVHPNPYEYKRKEQFYRRVDALKSAMPGKLTVREFFTYLSRLTAQLHDGHTGPGQENLSSTGAVFEKGFFPYRIKVVDDRIFVRRNYSYKENIPVGSEILTVNGIPSKQVINEVSKLIRYEGIAYRNFQLSLPIYINMWNNYREYTIVYQDTSHISHTMTTGGGWYAKIQFNEEMMMGHTDPYYEFCVLPGNIGYLGFYACLDRDRFRPFLHTVFEQVKEKGIHDLIIDIRVNGGGNTEVGNELLQYISPRPFKDYEKTVTKISRQVQFAKRRDWMSRYPEGSILEEEDTITIPLLDNPLRYSGRCYLLVGGGTFSAASDFASAFRCYTSGKIIGSETGGVTVCYGDKYDFSLPASGILMGVSSIKFHNVCGVDNRRGIVPDYTVENSFEDDRNGTDRVLQFTLGLISSRKQE